MPHILIIGASDAGISAGLRIRELSPETEVTIAARDAYPNFSICGLPFLIGGQVSDWRNLAHRSLAELETTGIRFLLEHTAQKIDPQQRRVLLEGPNGGVQITYDQLIIATGAEPLTPPIDGLDQPGVFPLRFMADAFAVEHYLASKRPASALIIGAGYIGMEMAEAFHRRGLSVTVAEAGPAVMPTLAPAMGAIIQKDLEAKSVRVLTRAKAVGIDRTGDGLHVRFDDGTFLEAGIVLIPTGVKPASNLARHAGVTIGASGAIAVDRSMATNIPRIFAAGDCAETWHRMLEKAVYLPLGTTAHKQGRVAGQSAVGRPASFAGALGTQVVKIFDVVAGRTGLLDTEATHEGYVPFSVHAAFPDHKAYYPSAHDVHIVISGDRGTGRLLGGQLIGRFGTEISKRIDVLAAALSAEMTVSDLTELDLSYTPPLSSPWDPLQMAAFKWLRGVGKDNGRTEF